MPSATRHVYVISDLHIGGVYPDKRDASKRGFRMCRSVPALVDFIRGLAGKPASAPRLELVINGDFVDFLAETWAVEPVFRPFVESEQLALRAFCAIADRDQPLFDALAELLAAGHDLTLLLGNHDVELAYGALRAELARRLRIDDARGQLRFLIDGEAYVAGDLLIEHGNRYDGYNVIDHDGLRRLRSAASRRTPLPDKFAYRVPPGSVLVSTVMNRIKQQYPFVDLLKPENEASIPILLALSPGARRHALAILRLRREAKKHEPGADGEPRFAGDTAWEAGRGAFSPELADELARRDAARTTDELAALLDHVMPGRGAAFVSTLRSQSEADDSDPTPHGADYGALLRLAIGRAKAPLSSRLDALHDALQALRGDTSWDREQESAEYMKSVEKRFAAGFRCVIYGHTHLAKCVRSQRGIYINTGTWADLIKVPRSVLSTTPDGRAALQAFCTQLENADLTDIAKPEPTYAHITLERIGEAERVQTADLEDFTGHVP